MNAISTYSGLQLKELEPKKASCKAIAKNSEEAKNEKVESTENMVKSVKPPPPFPQRLKKQKEESFYQKFVNLLNRITLTFILLMFCRVYQNMLST